VYRVLLAVLLVPLFLMLVVFVTALLLNRDDLGAATS